MDKFNQIYQELVEVSKEILPYYDIDKVKPYSVYVWNKEIEGEFGENLFDIHQDKTIFYNEDHKIIEDALPAIVEIQSKLKELKTVQEKREIERGLI